MRSPAPAPARGAVVLPGALSPLTADLVRGPRRPAVVLAAPRAGVYLGLGGRVLPVLAADALALPGAVRLARPAHEVSPGVEPGDVVVVGAGTVRLPGMLVRGVRTWRPARVRPHGTPPVDALGAVGALLVRATRLAPGWLVSGVARAVVSAHPEQAVADLVGRGPGLTPSGDDALAGALLVRRALGLGPRAADDPLAAAVRHRLATTTAVSAALLEAAADGWAMPEAVGLAEAAARGDVDGAAAVLPRVLAVGHTSGRDLATGVAAALQVLTCTRSPAA